MKIFTNLLPTITLFILSLPLFAQSGVGKLSGKVVDADTKEPLVGANIVILNTDWGAATDINGDYFILNIPPGNYDVRFSFVGYAAKTFQEVRIVTGITYELNADLSTDFTLPDIIVEDRKFFEEKATNTKKVIDAEQINRLPVKGVEKLASLQAGVVIQEGNGGNFDDAENYGNVQINVRGGRGGEVLYIVDGVAQNDVYRGVNYSQVSNAAIEQIAFEIGGYEAKYGQAQSGIINLTTKSGDPTYSLYGDVLSSTFTDDYGYNLYTASIGGPIIPGIANHTFFLSGERGWYLDGDPRAINPEFPSINKSYDHIPDNGSDVYRFTARTSHSIESWTIRLGANVNQRNLRLYTHSYTKNNSAHNRRVERFNQSYSAKISQNVSSHTFWNLNLGFKQFNEEYGDGVYFDDLMAYGDSLKIFQTEGVNVPGFGVRIDLDSVGIFYDKGRVFNEYRKTKNNTLSADLDLTSQLENHLLEMGGGINYNLVRYYRINPVTLASKNLANVPVEERFRRLQPTVFGYDITGTNETGSGYEFEPKTPLIVYGYLQDRFELNDMVLNIGVRFDYLDTQTDILANPELPYAAGDPTKFDAADFITKEPEFYVSPRIGLGFPVTSTTVFHAQYGKFIQAPPFDELYSSIFDYNALLQDDAFSFSNGHLESEVTTGYEVGFRQVLGNVAALNITAFYKNTKGLVNRELVFFQREPGGEQLEYYAPSNSDFGTIKGLSFSADVSRIGYFSMSLNYTYALAEGTGSSTSSSFVAAFRNIGDNRIPKVIAPLDFDQRHTGVVNFDFYVPEGDLGFFELINANVLVSFSSGRPYTPLQQQNLREGDSNWGQTTGYVNSAYGPGNFRIDLKVEKGFAFGSAVITPYLWIENLLDDENVNNVYRSTGSPYTTSWLSTQEGQRISAGSRYPEAFRQDYMSLERNPLNFGIPRLIKLGLKVNFSNIQF